MKMLFIVNNGQFEYVQIVAPHEEWTFMDASCNQVCLFERFVITFYLQIDFGVQSKYECYRRLSAQLNGIIGTLTPSASTVRLLG
jgi:hypothetical protein